MRCDARYNLDDLATCYRNLRDFEVYIFLNTCSCHEKRQQPTCSHPLEPPWMAAHPKPHHSHSHTAGCAITSTPAATLCCSLGGCSRWLLRVSLQTNHESFVQVMAMKQKPSSNLYKVACSYNAGLIQHSMLQSITIHPDWTLS